MAEEHVVHELRTEARAPLGLAQAGAVILGLSACAGAGTLRPLALVLGVAALVSLLLSLRGTLGLLPWSLAAIGVEYAVVDIARGEPLVTAPLYGAGLLLTAELAYASRELARGREENASRRVPWLLGVAVGGLGAALVPVGAAGISAPSGFGAGLVALVFSAALLAGPAVLLRRQADH